ncbi:MAG: DUF222 domain-containing protein [Acidimicrobiales bacterium]|nr:DUF222 domain-containing protein [Acidimicrobiales bacterium]
MSVIELQANEAGSEPPHDPGFAALALLREAATDVLDQPWAGRPGPVLGEALMAMVAAERMVAAAKARVLGAFDASGQHRIEGHPTAATWLGAKAKVNPRQVKHQAAQARSLREMPLTEAAFAAGRIGAEHVAVLVRARTRDVVDEFAAAEADLVESAETLDFDEFDRKVRDWRSFVQPDRSEKRARDAEQRREGHASRTFDDLVRLDAWLDPLGGTEFLDEFHRIEQEMFEADWAEARARVGERATQRDLRRTAKQRRADAFVEMARRSRAHGAPADGPRWVLNVMMGWHTLCAEAAATLADLGGCTCQLPPALARLLGLDPDADPGGRCPTCDGTVDAGDDDLPEPTTDPGSARTPEPYAGPPPTRRHRVLPDWWHAPDPFAPGFTHLRPDTLCELEDYTPIAPSQALGLGIAGGLRRIVFGPDGEVLDFGTTRPYPTGALREAVIIRDRVCRDPGCAVPGRHCQIDHVIPRSRGGPTAISNLRCQCGTGNRLKGTGPPIGDDPPTGRGP